MQPNSIDWIFKRGQDATPVLLFSPPGCGKTAWSRDQAQARGLPFFRMVAADTDPVDLLGAVVANRDDGTSMRLIPRWFYGLCEHPGVLLIDEITAAGPEQQAAALRLTDDERELDGHRLHPETIVIAAANPTEYAAGAARDLAAPHLSRFVHVHIGPELAVLWMVNQGGMVGRVGGYLKANASAALDKPETIKRAVEEQKPFACPRAWTRAARETSIDNFANYVGDGAQAGLVQFFHQADLPDPVEILAGRCKTVPKRGDAVLATAATMVGLCQKPTPEQLKCALEWFYLAQDEGHLGSLGWEVQTLVGRAYEQMGEKKWTDGLSKKILTPWAKLIKKEINE